MTGDYALETLALTEPTRLQRAEDRVQETHHRFGLELLHYREYGDKSPERAQRVELARQEWRRACAELEAEKMAADDDEELPFLAKEN